MKTTSRKLKDGTAVRYLHLAHNAWDPAAGRSVPQIAYSFGREDPLDRAAVKRLVASLSRLLDPADALAATADSELSFLESRPYGGTYALDTLWHRLDHEQVADGRQRAAGTPTRPGHRTHLVRAGRQPRTGAVLEAGRRRLDHP
ncbi:hypothetical protein AB0M44_11190 [Streptosporangium subroseum]